MKIFLVAIGLLGVACAELAKFEKCSGWSDDICEISEVRITPCKNFRYCQLTRGQESSIEFDFIPKFNAEKLTSSLFWASNSGDIPFDQFYNVDACQYSSCPTVADAKQQLAYRLRLDKKLPKGTYTFKWELADAADVSKMCCFKTEVKIR